MGDKGDLVDEKNWAVRVFRVSRVTLVTRVTWVTRMTWVTGITWLTSVKRVARVT